MLYAYSFPNDTSRLYMIYRRELRSRRPSLISSLLRITPEDLTHVSMSSMIAHRHNNRLFHHHHISLFTARCYAQRGLCSGKMSVCLSVRFSADILLYENLYSPHNSDSSSDKIDTKLYNKDNKNKLNQNLTNTHANITHYQNTSVIVFFEFSFLFFYQFTWEVELKVSTTFCNDFNIVRSK